MVILSSRPNRQWHEAGHPYVLKVDMLVIDI